MGGSRRHDWLLWLARTESRSVLVNALVHRVEWITVHQGLFTQWAVLTELHVLARMVPALLQGFFPRAPGRPVDPAFHSSTAANHL